MITAEDVLATKYVRRGSGAVVIDPDRGAAGGQSLKGAMRDITAKRKKRRESRPQAVTLG